MLGLGVRAAAIGIFRTLSTQSLGASALVALVRAERGVGPEAAATGVGTCHLRRVDAPSPSLRERLVPPLLPSLLVLLLSLLVDGAQR